VFEQRPTTAAIVMAVCAIAFASAARPTPVRAATFKIVAADRIGDGFNDGTPRAPVGGNPRTTLGAQRLFVMQHAANIWGAALQSNVVISLGIEFGPFAANECAPTAALLGSAGPSTAFANFSGAPRADTMYASALADSLAGRDLYPGATDISAEFNQDIDSGCFNGAVNGWYYGIDNNPSPGTINLLQVVLHELAHGLGFASFVDYNGTRCCGGSPMDDAFIVNLEWHEVGLTWPYLTDEERVLSMYAGDGLHWIGANVRAASGSLTAGRTGDHVQMFAPVVFQPGASVSHFSTTLTPNDLLEPFLSSVPSRELTLKALQDIGWRAAGAATPTATHRVAPTRTPTPPPTFTATASATNTPTPTAFMTPTIRRSEGCGCDCNADGQVSIGEVQGVANIYLAVAPVENCPDADVNRDDLISIQEVQRAANEYLIGCP
jgi:hypothetical protein